MRPGSLRTTRPPAVLASLVTLVTLVTGASLTACTDSDGDREPASGSSSSGASAATDPVDVPPAIAATWSKPEYSTSYLAPTIAGDVLLDRTERSVRGIELDTGDLAWTAEMPAGLRVCQVAPQSGRQGYVGLLLEGRGRPCNVVAALDSATGELAWTREVPGPRPYHEGRSVATGATTVAATFNCDELRRFRITDGTPLGIIGPKDRKCAMQTVTDGRVVLALDDPETADTPDDLGTGFIPPSDAAGAFELYDLDSGRLRWRREIETTRGASADAVISSTGPSTVVAYGEGSTITMRIVDEQGRPGAYLGRRLGYDEVPTVVGEADGVVVLRYADSASASLLFGYDVATGEELWHLDHPDAAEVDGGGLVLATPAYVPTEGEVGWQTWLTRVDLRDPEQVVTLGSIPGQAVTFLGDRVIVDEALYPVPDEGEERAYDIPPSPQAIAWGDDDVTSAEVALACDAVSRDTLGLLGLDHPELPPPSDCRWSDSSTPTYLEQDLAVTVTAVAPGVGGASYDEELSGAEMATDQVEQQIENTASYRDPLEELELSGLGDQAWALVPADPYLSGPSARVIVRWRNVLVDVTASQETRIDDRRYGAVPDDQVEPAVLAAIADVLRGLGAPDEDVAVPPTPTTDAVVPSVCRTLRTEAATLTPGLRASDQTPRGDGSTGPTRQSACVWWSEDEDDDSPELAAMVHVVPAGPLGASARDQARLLLPGGFARTRPVPGLPGVRARFFRFAGDSGYRSVGIYAIQDDTIVVADYTDPSGGLERAEGDRIAVRLTRQLLASVRR